MRILITGGKGQLGADLEKELAGSGGHEVICLGRDRLDVTRPEQAQEAVAAVRPDAVVHAAAATNVDRCELEPDGAYLVNALGTRNMAAAAARAGAKLVYISTDYVFDGRQKKPYTEFDPPAPLSVYGKSKLAGEKYAAAFSGRFFIVRTSWLYGRRGNNFVQTMLKLAAAQPEVTVVNDQVGTPTFAEDLARCIGALIQTELYGIYHASNSGACSWFDFARAIFRLAGLDPGRVRPISTAQLNRPAPRPAYSVLDNYCLRLQGLPDLRPWKEALEEFFHKYRRELPVV